MQQGRLKQGPPRKYWSKKTLKNLKDSIEIHKIPLSVLREVEHQASIFNT